MGCAYSNSKQAQLITKLKPKNKRYNARRIKAQNYNTDYIENKPKHKGHSKHQKFISFAEEKQSSQEYIMIKSPEESMNVNPEVDNANECSFFKIQNSNRSNNSGKRQSAKFNNPEEILPKNLVLSSQKYYQINSDVKNFSNNQDEDKNDRILGEDCENQSVISEESSFDDEDQNIKDLTLITLNKPLELGKINNVLQKMHNYPSRRYRKRNPENVGNKDLLMIAAEDCNA